MPSDRAILHVDMDAFFASVEQLDDPSIRGKPVLVGHDGLRGVVAAASYEAREFGCHSAQPMAVAKRRCPHAIIRPGRFARYQALSRQVFAIFGDVTPLVEPLSVDEAFLDVTGSRRLLGPAIEIARAIKSRIKSETGLTASVGVAPNKFLAKLCSEWEKPDGLTVVTESDLDGRIAALSVGRMWGVGPAMEAKLHRFGLLTFRDLQKLEPEDARQMLGAAGEHFCRLARGADFRDVTPDSRARSIGNEQTFGVDVESLDHLRQVLLNQVEHVALRLRVHDLYARTMTVKIRYGDFETITRSATLPHATSGTDALWEAARTLFDRWAERSFRPVRLIGATASNLGREGESQLELFPDRREERGREVDAAADAIRARFGRKSIQRGLPLE